MVFSDEIDQYLYEVETYGEVSIAFRLNGLFGPDIFGEGCTSTKPVSIAFRLNGLFGLKTGDDQER